MSGRFGYLKGYYSSVRDEVAKKLRGGFTAIQNGASPLGTSPQVEYPQKSYEPDFAAPGYQMPEVVEEQPIEQMAPPPDPVEQMFEQQQMPHEMPMPQGGLDDPAFLSHAEEIDRAIEQAAGTGELDVDSFADMLDDLGFFDGCMESGSAGLEEVLGDPFMEPGPAGGLEEMIEGPMMEDQFMDDQMMDGGGM